MAIEDKRYTQAEIIEAVGLSAATIQTWANRGLFNLKSGANPGTGQKRQYSAHDALSIALMDKLSQLYFPLSAAAQITFGLWDLIDAHAADIAGARQIWLVIHGETKTDLKVKMAAGNLSEWLPNMGTPSPVFVVVDLAAILNPVLLKLGRSAEEAQEGRFPTELSEFVHAG